MLSSSQRIFIVSGKGGVGKSLVSSALALALAGRGLRTLVCEVNAKERISVLLEQPLAGPQITPMGDNLWSVNVQPQDALREYALMIVKFNTIYNAVFQNRVVHYFLRFVPSLQELVLLGKILFHAQEKDNQGRTRFDRVIIDAPATGHAVSFFRVPQVLLATVPPGPLATEAKKMNDILTDAKRTAAILVCIPEEMPLVETAELQQALKTTAGIGTEAIVLNAFIPERFSLRDLEQIPDLEIRSLAEQHHRRSQASLAARDRLSALGCPVWPVPRLYGLSSKRELVTRVVSYLSPLVDSA